MILDVLAVAAGGALGAVLRFGLLRREAGRAERAPSAWDPAARATFAANVGGCALFGFWGAAAASVRFSAPPQTEFGAALDLFMLTGLCGGWTTFSTVIADGVRLGSERSSRSAFTYAASTLVAGILALWIGLRFAG